MVSLTKDKYFSKEVQISGTTFGNTTFITNTTTGDSFNPQITSSANSVYMLWQHDLGNVSKQQFFKKSTTMGLHLATQQV